MKCFNYLFFLFLLIGTFKKSLSYNFYLNKNNYRYYYYQLNNVEKNIYNSIINNLKTILLEEQFVEFNVTSLIQSSNSNHVSENTTIQNIYLIFKEQLNEFRSYFNNAKNAVRYDYPELFYIDWDELTIDYSNNGKLILVHKDEIIADDVLEEKIVTNESREEQKSSDKSYKKTYNYLYKGISEKINPDSHLSDINNLVNQQTEFIYYKIIKDAYIDIPIISSEDYSWYTSSFNYGIHTVINNVIENIFSNVKAFDFDNITYGKKNITDKEFIDRNANEVYGLFKSGYATSVNLAKTFKLAMNYIGIDCVLVWGNTTDNVRSDKKESSEMWNVIYLYNEWYSIDLSFNYYKICKLDNKDGKRRGLKTNLFVDCTTEDWNNIKNSKRIEVNTKGNETNEDEIKENEINGDGTNGNEINGDGTNGDGTNGDGINGDGTNGDGINGDGTNDDGTGGDGTDENEKEEEEIIELQRFTFFGSELITNYLKEDSTIFTSKDTKFYFPILSPHNFDLNMKIRLSHDNYNFTTLTNLDEVTISSINENFHNINSKESLFEDKLITSNKKRVDEDKEVDVFVNMKVKSIDYKIYNNNELLENILISYNIFSENFDIKSMSYILAKEIHETKYVKVLKTNANENMKQNENEMDDSKIDDNNINSNLLDKNSYSVRDISENKKRDDGNETNDFIENRYSNITINNNDYYFTLNLPNDSYEIEKRKFTNSRDDSSIDVSLIKRENNKNNTDTLVFMEEELSLKNNNLTSDDYTYAKLTKHYTTYQFIPGHTFLNVNKDDTNHQYISLYIIYVSNSDWYKNFGENFTIGKEGYEEYVEGNESVVKEYKDWTNFTEKNQEIFKILYQTKYKYHDASLPLTRKGITINYKESTPLPNYYIDLKSTDITVCYNEPLVLSNEQENDISLIINYSILNKPILKDDIDNVHYYINDLKFDSTKNCLSFEFSPDFDVQNIIYYFQVNGLVGKDNKEPVPFTYIIDDNQDIQRTILYQESINDKSPLTRMAYSIPYKSLNNLLFTDKYNNLFYKNDVIISSNRVEDAMKVNLIKIINDKDNPYEKDSINTEFLIEINMKSMTGTSLTSNSDIELFIPWTNQFTRYNYDTYSCYTFTKETDGNPKEFKNCEYKFYSYGIIVNIRSSQYLWIISHKTDGDNNLFTKKSYQISYSIYKDVSKENEVQFSAVNNSDNLDDNLKLAISTSNDLNQSDSNTKGILDTTNADQYQPSLEKDICKTLNIIYQNKMKSMNFQVESINIDNTYRCYFDKKTKFKYYCADIKTGAVVTTSKDGICKIEKHNTGLQRLNKRDNQDTDIWKVNDIDALVPESGIESTWVYFTVVSPSNFGVKKVTITDKESGETIYSLSNFGSNSNSKSSSNNMIHQISLNQSYRFLMPPKDIEISIEFANNNLKIDYIIIDDYKVDIVEGQYLYYIAVKDKSKIAEKPITIKAENPNITYNVSYFALNEEIYITIIAENNEYVSYTFKYKAKDENSDRSAVSMIYINRKPLNVYPDNSNIFIYCNPDPLVTNNDLLDKISIKEISTATLSSYIQGNKISVKVIAENKFNFNLYTIVPLEKDNEIYNLYCLSSSISDNDYNKGEDNNKPKNNDESSGFLLSPYCLRKTNIILTFVITFVLYIILLS